MGDPGNPSDAGTGPDPDPDQPGWASPTPPPPPAEPPPPAAPPPPQPAAAPPPQPLAAPEPAYASTAPAWGTPPPAAPGATGAWGDTPGPPPKKRRLIWLWILIPVLLVMTASAIVAIVFGVKLFIGPIDATDDYYANLRDGQYAAAYDNLCAAAQRAFTVEDFIAQQESDEDTKGRVEDFDFTDLEFDDESFDSSSIDATVKGEVRRSQATYDVRVGLRREDGDWRVCAIRER